MKKTFFKDAAKAQIKKKKYTKITNLSDIVKLRKNEFTIIEPIFAGNYDSGKKFMKHGPEVLPRRQYSIKQAVNEKLTPIQLREDVFNHLNGPYYCSYSFMPLGKDSRKRKVSLRECLEGARIYAYSHQVQGVNKNPEIIVKPYDKAQRVAIDGAEITIELPSRTKNHKRIDFKLMNIPVIDSKEKYAISLNFSSTHSCPAKKFKIRYPYLKSKETSQVFNICAHEIASYLKVIEHYWNKKKNIIPLQMCQFAIPTQKTVDFYLKLNNNLLIKDVKLKSKDKLRKPRIADLEIGLWGLVRKLGHDETFCSQKSRDGNIADYDWSR